MNEEVLSRIKRFCPQMEVSIVPTQTRRKIQMIVIQDLTSHAPLDDWAVFEIYPLYRRIYALLEETDMTSLYRVFFHHEEKIVFYIPRSAVFLKMNNAPYGDWYGEYMTSHFVGVHRDPMQVLKFLTQTEGLLL